MSEYNKQKYYWIKLQTNFYESNEKIDYLMSQKDGSNYVVLYQMLCLKSVNSDGNLSCKVGEIIIPYDVNKIVRDCKYFSKDTVVIALELYKQIGLVYVEQDGTLQIANYAEMVGSQTISAHKKEIQRGGQVGGHLSTKILDIRDKSIEYRDKNIEIEENIYIDTLKNNISSVSNDTAPKRFVKPTVEEVRAYCEERNNGIDAEQFVSYYESNGWKVGRTSMKDWRACVRTWEKRNGGKVKAEPPKPRCNYDTSKYRDEEDD